MPCCEDDTCPVEDLKDELASLLDDVRMILITIVHSDDNYKRGVVSQNTNALIEKLGERLQSL